MKYIFHLLILILPIAFLSCSDNPDPVDPPKQLNAELTAFSPSSGAKGTLITIEGKNFGTKASDITLKINGLPAIVKSVKDNEITATVPDKCGLGPLVLSLNGKEIKSAEKFRYIYKATTSYFTGGEKGYADGAARSVKFEGPYNLVFDTKELLYVADLGNCMVRKIEKDGTTSTVAGTPHSGFKDGKGDHALMKFPIDVDVAPDGTIYVADHQNNAIRKIGPDGTLTTLTGNPDREGLLDGDLATAKFKRPYGVKIDPSGILWICDTENAVIRKISPAGQVTTFAGSTQGYADGKLLEAKFYFPAHLTFDENGSIYIADKHNHCIRKITPDGMVTTFAGMPEKQGFKDGAAKDAMFNQPSNVQIDKLGNLYVTDLYNHCIRLIYPDGWVMTLAGQPGNFGYIEGTGANAKFYHPQGSTLDKEGNLFVTDSFNNRIRKLTIE
ncbi:IPT/TIG domain-containing protein [Dyadobacter sp. CY323]|uniref:IPT/TIG domain-containing protein n=1 Tax=Dyadobacter sp. CY323 TaxID=2907302 RepID=UPI001F45D922|nr:IPT/TIG domain-containing protein [Dyadobacter sp. CY323]MCE6988131.1 IPT/TIG domain-containing protein [Dyadobacter sp. CY323]